MLSEEYLKTYANVVHDELVKETPRFNWRRGDTVVMRWAKEFEQKPGAPMTATEMMLKHNPWSDQYLGQEAELRQWQREGIRRMREMVLNYTLSPRYYISNAPLEKLNWDTNHAVFFHGASATKLTGKQADFVITDDPHNNGATDMNSIALTQEAMAEAGLYIDPASHNIRSVNGKHSLQVVAAAKAAKPPKKDYNTIGVRFLYGTGLDKVYTYLIRKGAKVTLGQELVVPSTVDGRNQKSVAVVVEIHTEPQDTLPGVAYKYVESKVAAL